jgi:D-tyrosyl-tRNA(Tyr) deacylase
VRAVVTRVTSAAVTVAGTTVGAIDAGLLVLLGVAQADEESDAIALARKVVELRIFADAAGAMNRSLAETGGAVLVVSQFTLLGDVRKGRRPSFMAAAPPERGRALYERFVRAVRELGPRVATGEFGASMAVASVNDGPVTILLDTAKAF